MKRWLILLAIPLLIWLIYAIPAKGSGEWVTVRVVRGDTLWEYAKDYAPHTDPRAYVETVLRENKKEDARLWVGETIQLWREGEK